MRNKFEVILAAIFLVLAVALVIGLPMMLLWNWLMPTIFGLTKITFWQAVGVNILSYMLFGHTNTVSKDK
jgi:hypothetical protein